MSEVVERIADDLQRKLKERGYLRFERQHLLWMVRTIVEGLREPTADMLAAVDVDTSDSSYLYEGLAEQAWQQMIDAALTSSEPRSARQSDAGSASPEPR